jgi:hypothetical protein
MTVAPAPNTPHKSMDKALIKPVVDYLNSFHPVDKQTLKFLF